MSIASELTRLQNAKTAIRNAIEAEGVTVGSTKLDGMASLIGQISGGGTEGTLTISELTYAEYVSVQSQLSLWPFITLSVGAVKCTVTFKNESGTVLETKTVNMGSATSYSGATPTKTATAQYSYTFDYWMSNGSRADLSNVQGGLVLTPHFAQTLRSYTIRFLNADGTVLQSKSVAYGTTPSYAGSTPTKSATAQYTYTFSGWSPSISAVTGARDYTAQYSSTVRSYTISFVVDGTTTTRSYQYGATPSYGSTPSKDGYEFTGWSPSIASVSGNATYTAQFRDASVTVAVSGKWRFNTTVDVSTARSMTVPFVSNGTDYTNMEVR